MFSLSSITSTKSFIFASLSNNNQNHSLKSINIENDFRNKPKLQKPKQKQPPSVAEIERVIGAGVFRDRDASDRNAAKNKTLFDSILSNSIGMSEGKVERKLRETGEWLIEGTEKTSNSAGKHILLFMFSVVLPLWIMSFLFATGIVRLPFNTSYFDDFIM